MRYVCRVTRSTAFTVPAPARIHHRSTGKTRPSSTAGVVGAARHQGCHVRVAADHAVEGHDVGRLHLLGEVHEVPIPVDLTIPEPASLRLEPGRRQVRSREVDVDGAGGARSEQLVLDRPDPAPDVEQARPAHPFRDQCVEEALGVARRPVAPVVVELALGVAIVEEGVVVDAAAAGLRHGAIIDEFGIQASSYLQT